jgi:hypothetical protein
MAQSKRWVVRICTQSVGLMDKAFEDTPLLECLRYAGLVRVHRNTDVGMCFDILPPNGMKGASSMEWAMQSAGKMQSFGLNAVAAPEML